MDQVKFILPAELFLFIVNLIISLFKLRILSYYHGGTANNVIDPSPERKRIYQKADKLKPKIILSKKTNIKSISCPKEFTADLQNLNPSDGWSKNLANLSNLTLDKIAAYVERVNKILLLQNRRKFRSTSNEDSSIFLKKIIDLNSFKLF